MTKKFLYYCFAFVAFVASSLSATSVNAQYYGGVTLGATLDANGQLFAGRTSSIGGANSVANFGSGSDRFTPTEQLTVAPAAGLQLSNEPSLGIKLGYRFNPHFAVESRYVSANLTITTPSLFNREVINITRHEQTLGLDLVGNVSLMKKLSLQGRAGLRSEPTLFNNPSAGGPAPTASGVMGLSLNYNINSSLGLRFEVERSRKFFNERFAGDADSAVSFGVLWRF